MAATLGARDGIAGEWTQGPACQILLLAPGRRNVVVWARGCTEGAMRGVLALAAAAVIGMAASAADAQAAARSEIPVRFVRLSDGVARFSVPITIAGTTIEAGLDSGSTGLRVLPGVVPGSAAAKGPRNSYSYGSGTRLNGVIAEEPLAFGGASGASPVQLVQTVDCNPSQNAGRCPAQKIALDQFGIQGDGLPGEGFKAILGVNMGPDEAPNPLIKLGVKRWIIELPRPGDDKPGRLILNPTEADLQGYALFKIDADYGDLHGGMHDAIPGCVQDLKLKRSFCGPALLDTGAPGIQVVSLTAEAGFPPGDPGEVVFLQGTKPAVGAQFPIGSREINTGFSVQTRPRLRSTQLMLGLSPYYAFSVLYDPEAKTVGLKAR
jgi:hypothetical protein